MRHLGVRRQPGKGAWLGQRAGADAEVTGTRARRAQRRGAKHVRPIFILLSACLKLINSKNLY
jgi:hypothetical protein